MYKVIQAEVIFMKISEITHRVWHLQVYAPVVQLAPLLEFHLPQGVLHMAGGKGIPH